MKCKHCGAFIELSLKGYKNFCSPPKECKKLYLRELARLRKQRQRDRHAKNEGDTLNVTQNAENNNEKSSTSEPDFEGFGGRRWYDIARVHCVNFSVRVKEGYCVTFSHPYRTFKKKCSNCVIAQHYYTSGKNKTNRRKSNGKRRSVTN